MTRLALPRSLARLLRAVFRRCSRKPSGPHPPLVQLRGGKEGLHVRVAHPEVSVAYHHPAACAAGTVYLPLTALADFEGRTQDAVILEPVGADKTVAHWLDGGVPKAVEYAVGNSDERTEFPRLPGKFARCRPGILQALDRAAQTASCDGSRFAIHRLLLRGKAGQIVATDGKQLLVQGGFDFPWGESLLVPRLPVFACRELGDDPAAEVGRTGTHVVLRVGPWAFFLRIDADARYPNVEQAVPRATGGASRLRIGPEDAAFLARTLPRLPGSDDDDRPCTLDLDGRVCVRARAAGRGEATEVVLARSDYSGKPVRACVNRDYLARALRLGFQEVEITDADAPLVCRDKERMFLFMPLSKEGIIARGGDASRITSAEEDRPRNPPTTEREKPTVSTDHVNTNGNGHAAMPRPEPPESPEQGRGGYEELLAEALALRQTLHDACGRATRLVAAVKKDRRRSRLVATTLASLEHLHRIDGR